MRGVVETMMNEMKKTLSLDAESNGLWGQAFAIAGIVYDEAGNEVDRFAGQCSIEGEIDKFVAENVLPQMAGIELLFDSYQELLRAFFEWRAPHKAEGVQELVHMGVPVESRLYMDAHSMGFIGDWDGPYPLLDVAAVPEIGDSVDGYNRTHNCGPDPEEFEGGTHNPLYDSAAAYAAYRHWLLSR